MTIKNGDMPAMPVDRCDTDAIEAGIQVFSGLTKREMMAIAAMHGLLANSSARYADYKYMAQNAVTAADALLTELERTK